MAEPDLNLLRVFDMLMTLRNVTRAGERLHLSQSAVSHALGRLRHQFGDPLFVRSSTGLQPTALAEQIAPGIRDGLSQLRDALSPPVFDPLHVARRFTIAMGSYYSNLLTSPLVKRLQREAPAVTLRTVPITDTLVAGLERGRIDVALGGKVEAPPRYVTETLAEEHLVWIAARGHRLVDTPIEMSKLAGCPKVVISLPRPLEPHGDYDTDGLIPRLFIETDGVNDDAVVRVYDPPAAIDVVAETDLIAVVPERLAARAARLGRIAIISPSVATRRLTLLWHSRSTSDAGLAWLRATIRVCLSDIGRE